jgi:hypothetical protein
MKPMKRSIKELHTNMLIPSILSANAPVSIVRSLSLTTNAIGASLASLF